MAIIVMDADTGRDGSGALKEVTDEEPYPT